jgi:hypothetical protein
VSISDHQAAVEALYAEMAIYLRHLAEVHRTLATHYRIGSIAQTEHRIQSSAATRVADYWAANRAQHQPDMMEV